MTLDSFFRLKASGTSVRTELLAGLTTFLAMAYILAVNPVVGETTLCLGIGNGIECLFRLHDMCRFGIFLAICTDGSIHGGDTVYYLDIIESS